MKRTILRYVKNKNDPSINLSPWNKEYEKKKLKIFGQSCSFISCLWSSVCPDSSLSFFSDLLLLFFPFVFICNCSFYATYIHINIMDTAS